MVVLYGYRVVNIFLNGTHVRSRVNLVHFKGVQLDPYETYMMKLTCCTWDCLLEHGAHSRHITQYREGYIFLRNDWHIDVPWNISKISYSISFFFCSSHGFDIELYDILYMQFVHIANWCTWLAHTLCKGLIWNYKNCWAQPWLPFGILQVLRWSCECIRYFFFWLIQDFVLKFGNMHN